MKFFNIGLDRTGLESFRNAMIQLGFRPPRGFAAYKNWRSELDHADFIYGPPYLQRINEVLQHCKNITILVSIRPAADWHRSCQQNHTLQQNPHINDHRLAVYGALSYDFSSYERTRVQWEDKIATLQKTYPLFLLPLQDGDRDLWEVLEDATTMNREYPHINKTLAQPDPYARTELVG